MYMKRVKNSSLTYSIISCVVLVIFLIISLLPVLYMVSISLMDNQDFFAAKLIPSHFEWENYPTAWKTTKIGTYFKNSIIVCVASVVVTVAIASLAGYAFARFHFWGRDAIFYILLLAMMIPPQAILIPLFVNLKKLNLIDTYAALIGPYTGLGFSFAMYILKAFFETLPREIEDAAKIDGAGSMRIFLTIMLPLVRPALSTVTIFLTLTNWNEFILALTFITNEQMRTLPIGIYSLLSVEYYANYPTLAAALAISSLPIVILYLIFQKQFIKGLTAGAIKG